ncbi:MAG: hypothetical protein R3231_09710 [bacterium]|nr:hypothetical protein [bacterium]
MVRLVILFLWGWLFYLLARIILSLITGSGKDRADREGEATLVHDPNCNTFIAQSAAIKRRIKGKTYYFCSTICFKEYRKGLKS